MVTPLTVLDLNKYTKVMATAPGGSCHNLFLDKSIFISILKKGQNKMSSWILLHIQELMLLLYICTYPSTLLK